MASFARMMLAVSLGLSLPALAGPVKGAPTRPSRDPAPQAACGQGEVHVNYCAPSRGQHCGPGRVAARRLDGSFECKSRGGLPNGVLGAPTRPSHDPAPAKRPRIGG